jgi:hypothetical protein
MYVMFINIHFIFLDIYVYIYYYIFYNKLRKLSHNYLQINTKLKHKELFKIWTQCKGKHSNIKSEYDKESVIGMYRYFCFQLRT